MLRMREVLQTPFYCLHASAGQCGYVPGAKESESRVCDMFEDFDVSWCDGDSACGVGARHGFSIYPCRAVCGGKLLILWGLMLTIRQKHDILLQENSVGSHCIDEASGQNQLVTVVLK